MRIIESSGIEFHLGRFGEVFEGKWKEIQVTFRRISSTEDYEALVKANLTSEYELKISDLNLLDLWVYILISCKL